MRAMERELKSYFKDLRDMCLAFLLLFVGIYTMIYNLRAIMPTSVCPRQHEFRFHDRHTLPDDAHAVGGPRQKTDLLLYSLPMSTERSCSGNTRVSARAGPPIPIMRLPDNTLHVQEHKFPHGIQFHPYFLLLGATLISVGMFISSVTESQVVAAILSFVVILVNFFITGLSNLISSAPSTSLIACAIAAALLAVVIGL